VQHPSDERVPRHRGAISIDRHPADAAPIWRAQNVKHPVYAHTKPIDMTVEGVYHTALDADDCEYLRRVYAACGGRRITLAPEVDTP
jgi:hypothetical protein